MTPFLCAAGILAATFFSVPGPVPAVKKPAGVKPPITIVTDNSWEVSANPTRFGEYPLSAAQIASATAALQNGAYKAVEADFFSPSTIIPGTMPIWRNRRASGELEAYQFRKTVPLGADPIQKITLEINCDDAARIYINKRLVSAEHHDKQMEDGNGDSFLFRSISGFNYAQVYTYDVTDYFFTNVTNTILAEAVSVAFAGGHSYISAKLVIEFAPAPEPARPAVPAKRQPAAKPQANAPPSAAATVAPTQPAAAPENTVFEAGNAPGIESLNVGSILELGQVNFRADDYKLDSASYRTLDAFVAFLKRHPGLKVEIGGHTNLRPTDQFAARLSDNRARAVAQYLTDNGVAANRVAHKGYGKSQPRINAISTAADRANQRVEVRVLAK